MSSLLGLLAKIKVIFLALYLPLVDPALEPWKTAWKPLAFTRNPLPEPATLHLRALYRRITLGLELWRRLEGR